MTVEVNLIGRLVYINEKKVENMEGFEQQPGQSQQAGYAWVPGATTIGVVCHDGVILASEKRVSYGNFIMSKGGKKVFKITERIGAACAGLVSDMQVLVRDVEANANLFSMDVGRRISVRASAKLMSNILFNRRMMPLIAQTIVAGLDEEGPSLYVLDVLGSLIPDKYAVVGSGTEIAMGVLEEGYKDGMKIQRSKRISYEGYKIRHKQRCHER